MINRVKEYINRYGMINNGDKVIVALSGGPDSICLIHILNSLKNELGFKLYAAHINHCLRGKEADDDEEYVKEFCRSMDIDIFVKKVDINSIAKMQKISTEMAGRNERYSFFYELKEKLKAGKIAVAHNKNDQAETILMRLMRGSSIEGLRGIRPVRDDIFIRPILFLSREEIEKYCRDNELKPRIDKTNSENVYNRNKVRLELIPYIQQNFNPDIVETLNRFSNSITRDENFIENIAKEKYNNLCKVENDKVIIYGDLINEDEAVCTRVIRMAIHQVYGSLYDIESVHIYEIIKLLRLGTGRKINLPKGIVCENIYGKLYLKREKSAIIRDNKQYFVCKKSEIDEQREKEITIPEHEVKIRLRVKSKNKKLDFDGQVLTKYFDYDKIRCNIGFRFRREGDRFSPLGMSGNKKLKDLFMDLKIPKENRDTIPLLCFDDEISWVIGYRVSNKFAVTKDTNNILEVKIVKGE